jgi:hypothetical protein
MRSILTISLFFFLFQSWGQGEYGKAYKAYEQKNYADFLANMKIVSNQFPNHPDLMLDVAKGFALTGQADSAYKYLRILSRLNYGYPIDTISDFKSLWNAKEFKAVKAVHKKNASPSSKAQIAYTLPDKEFFPEGIAVHEKTGRFYVGSLHKDKVIKIDEVGLFSDFSKPTDGLGTVIGLYIDQKQDMLYVCAKKDPERNYDETYAGLFQYDLNSGLLLKSWKLPNTRAEHLLNDLTKAGNDFYITDSHGGNVYKLSPGSDTLQLFHKGFIYTNGITSSADGKFLFVADYMGIRKINIADKSASWLMEFSKNRIPGIDGMYWYKNRLIAIQNGIEPVRVITIFIDEEFDKNHTVLPLVQNEKYFNIPTTGTIYRDTFYFIANSQLRMIDKGKIKPGQTPVNPLILKVNLK